MNLNFIAGIAPSHNFHYGNGGRGAVELGVRYTRFDASEFNAVLAPSTLDYTDGADAWTLGAKWILILMRKSS